MPGFGLLSLYNTVRILQYAKDRLIFFLGEIFQITQLLLEDQSIYFFA